MRLSHCYIIIMHIMSLFLSGSFYIVSSWSNKTIDRNAYYMNTNVSRNIFFWVNTKTGTIIMFKSIFMQKRNASPMKRSFSFRLYKQYPGAGFQ